MADDKNGRDKQAHNEEQRQRERALAEEIDRMDEAEPEIQPEDLADLETDLDAVTFPAAGSDIVAAVGDHEIEATSETITVEETIPDSESEVFDSPAAVRARVQRPTVAAEMKRIVETIDANDSLDFGTSQRDAYMKTLLALRAVDGDDDDEGVTAISDWIVGQITEKGKLPGSRGVRREAGKIARKQGHTVSSNDWLGV